MEIKVYQKEWGCLPEIIDKGDWVDVKLSEDVKLKGPYSKVLRRKKKDGEVIERYRDVVFDSTIASLGICVEVPKGYECIVVPRSSTFKKYGIIQSNSVGIIDQTYCSDEDEWKMPMTALRFTTIPKGTRIAQFRVQLSQKATMWQKIKWLFTSEIKIRQVASLDNKKRGGFGEGTKDFKG